MKTLEEVRVAYSDSLGEALVSLEAMEQLAGSVLQEAPYSPQDIKREFVVDTLEQIFDDSVTNTASIKVSNFHVKLSHGRTLVHGAL